MADEQHGDSDIDLDTQKILLASSNHDCKALRVLLRTSSANVQDPETGITPLHAAIVACEQDEDKDTKDEETDQTLSNGHSTNGVDPVELSGKEGDQKTLIEKAKQTLRLLLINGAIWNDLDNLNETPGCLARRLGLEELYEIMVDAGVRAEMLMSRMSEGWEILPEEDDEDDEQNQEVEDVQAVSAGVETDSNIGILPLGESVITRPDKTKPELSSDTFLQSDLSLQQDRILDENRNGVMMAWEADIMKRTADLLVPQEGHRILNIGHGMGIIDSLFQTKAPQLHHIIEAHPAILAQMKKDGWYEKDGVKVHEGRWQDVVPGLIEEGAQFDAIYFDTFAEDYKALRYFFSEHVIGILDENGRWGFFNGLGADRQICYDVYTKVVEMDALEAGFDVEWDSIEVPDLDQSNEWEGVRRRYWALKEYKLPIFTYIG